MPAWVVPAAIAAGQLIGRWIDQSRQKRENRAIAQYQASVNEEYQRQQNQYNSPMAQMARFKAGGLNPHLIYGQGTPGNQSSSLSYPSVQPTDMSGTFENIGSDYLNTQMLQTQMDATQAKTEKTITETDLKKLEKTVLERNPLLDSNGFKAIIDNLVNSAKIKEADLRNKGITNEILDKSANHMVNKLFRELTLLEDKHDLNVQDGKIKAQILRSQTFQADLAAIQQKWMTDAEITPQHIFQFIQAFLLKFIR